MTDIGRLKELSLFDAIQHGDDEHRAWLKAAITAHFAGEPVPPVSGSGRKDAEIETLRARLAAAEWMLRAAAGFVLAAPLKHPQQSEVKASLLEHMREWIDQGNVTI